MLCILSPVCSSFFFFNDTATTEIYTLSLHDALPILIAAPCVVQIRRRPLIRFRDQILIHQPLERAVESCRPEPHLAARAVEDRKSTRLNSSHGYISYAVFCLKKKKKHQHHTQYVSVV